MRALAKVEAWCARRGVAVVHDAKTLGDSHWHPGSRTITVGRLAPRSRLYTLLHECGHVLIDSGAQGYLTAFVEPERVETVAEEIEAWNRGRRLAHRLRIRIDARAWRRLRAHCLASYMRWATTR
jgi:hypothetical protein